MPRTRKSSSKPQKTTTKPDLERGLALRKKLNGRRWGKTSTPLVQAAPELEELVNEVLFGRIWSRGKLDLKMRSVAVIAALTATAQRPQLKNYIANALNVGLTKEEIIEVLIQLVFYTGLPKVVNAIAAAQEVFAEELE
ncbi:MAG TPA: carboxymuconolactone decarboxylase family protein [Kofleriaceae bacterium]